MSERTRWQGAWWLSGVAALAAVALFHDAGQVGASEDHERVRELRGEGAVRPLAELLSRPELEGLRVIEAELEREDGRLVYQLELLDERGQVHERYFDAVTGAPLDGHRGD